MSTNNKLNDKKARAEKANKFIAAIAGCGRNFFEHEGFISTLGVSTTGRVYFTDYYTKKRINTHKKGYWDGFTSGGTLEGLIESLRDFIMKDEKLNAEYFQPVYSNGFKNPWGYGEDILIVKAAALELGIAE